ncbi:DUF3034 family protein [Halomonas campisalis]|uniref:DUF3034 family protein n=1 Tax=Billgrantia campisalis TaxID=74661 RepID=A0ABS9PAM4_9GAMM|nr:DUF3034 family protein [Halomonas campisalis]MCG6658791.1 DUF3034 family protein [Halomonas campisalis]MDR5864754.1 DUF3034 family protein [Halomonas campisalis]
MTPASRAAVRPLWLILLCGLLLQAPHSWAGSRLLGTGGVTQIEGASGGGLSPWGVLTGTASEGEWAITATRSAARLEDYRLDVAGVAANWNDRLELSFARQRLGLDTLGGKLAQDIHGLKVRLFGDVLYHPWGIWSLGLQHKRLDDGNLARAVGARANRGNDIYLAGSKLFFDAAAGRNLLANLTLRSTKANQGGLLGFGGDRQASRSLVAEGSLGLFLTPNWVVGMEYRQKPDNLGFAREDGWQAAYSAFFFNKHVSLTGAWLDLGSIAGLDDQRGGYLSLQVAF